MPYITRYSYGSGSKMLNSRWMRIRSWKSSKSCPVFFLNFIFWCFARHRYAKFNPVNKMLITGILHENGDKVDYNMDHLINDNTVQSATYFLIELFNVFNQILESIEFVDSVNIGQCWNEIFTKIARFANVLELRKVIQLKQKSESRINYVSLSFGSIDKIENSNFAPILCSTAARFSSVAIDFQTEMHRNRTKYRQLWCNDTVT